ncbi:MAG: branched-chain amino acid ABC transporter permease [Desulfovibrionaceae bacterium]|nr:branched-chain amino acid ABC transporter permease [Desulfovibrionaceae bacterium]
MTAGRRDCLLNLLLIALLSGVLFTAEQHLDSYSVRILNLVAINAILAVSLNLIYGFTGMFSLGHAGFMAVGAYVCTLLILTPAQKETMWLLEEIEPWLANLSAPALFANLVSDPEAARQLGFACAVVAGGLAAALSGLIIALGVLRLGGDYLGIATLGFAEIIRVVITNVASITNGALGVKGIPQYTSLWWSYGWLLFTLYVIVVLLRSGTGTSFKAIRDDEIAARVMGVNTFYHRVLSFTIGAFFAGVGGALTAALISTIDPKMFNFMLTFNVLMIVVAGGLGSITGSIIGSVVITIMLEFLRPVDNFVPGTRMVIFSLLLLGIILFRRKGLMGTREFSWNFFFRSRRES